MNFAFLKHSEITKSIFLCNFNLLHKNGQALKKFSNKTSNYVKSTQHQSNELSPILLLLANKNYIKTKSSWNFVWMDKKKYFHSQNFPKDTHNSVWHLLSRIKEWGAVTQSTQNSQLIIHVQQIVSFAATQLLSRSMNTSVTFWSFPTSNESQSTVS